MRTTITCLLFVFISSLVFGQELKHGQDRNLCPCIVKRINLSNLTSGIVGETIFTPKKRGVYRISGEAVPEADGQVSFEVFWTDRRGIHVHYSCLNDCEPTAFLSMTIRAEKDQPITYNTFSLTQFGVYDVRIVVEWLE
jgi:hypothetical protein